MGVILVASRCMPTTNYAWHKYDVDIHHVGIGTRQNIAQSQLYKNVRSVVPWMLCLHFRQFVGICICKHDLAAQKQCRIEKGKFYLFELFWAPLFF